jgi:pantetheine-phosphate adenylyltransferase
MKYIYPGSFDPITNGHLDLIKRASSLCDTLYIVIGNNINKKYFFSVEDRIRMIKEATKNLNNVIIDSTNDLIVQYAKDNGIDVIVRGFRNTSDFEIEQEMYYFNDNLDSKIETIVLFSKLENIHISSSNIKELSRFNKDISKYVPKIVVEYLKNK